MVMSLLGHLSLLIVTVLGTYWVSVKEPIKPLGALRVSLAYGSNSKVVNQVSSTQKRVEQTQSKPKKVVDQSKKSVSRSLPKKASMMHHATQKTKEVDATNKAPAKQRPKQNQSSVTSKQSSKASKPLQSNPPKHPKIKKPVATTPPKVQTKKPQKPNKVSAKPSKQVKSIKPQKTKTSDKPLAAQQPNKPKALSQDQLQSLMAETEESMAKTQSLKQARLDEATLLIKAHIDQYWRSPMSVKKGVSTKVVLTVDDEGHVLTSKLVRHSGILPFDRSIQLAIEKASPLPLPKDPELKQSMHKITIVFT